MVASLLAFALLATPVQQPDSELELAQKKDRICAALSRLAGYGFAGHTLAIVLDPESKVRWKAAVWDHFIEEKPVPIAQETDLGFRRIRTERFPGMTLGFNADRADRTAMDLAMRAVRCMDHLSDRVLITVWPVGMGNEDFRKAIETNRWVQWADGAAVDIGLSGGVSTFLRIDTDLTLRRKIVSCLGTPRIPTFSTPGFP